MRRPTAFLLLLLSPLAFLSPALAEEKFTANWPQWRGPEADGNAPAATPPTEWSETKNVKWKVKIPGSGTSTPIIWGDKIFITTAIPTPKKISLVPGEGGKPENSNPSSSPAPVLVSTAEPAPPAAPPAAEAPPAAQPSPPREGRRGGGRGPGGGDGGGTLESPYQFQILCLDRATGRTLWQQTPTEEQPHEGHHQDHGFASHSPITDGTHVYAYFGSRGLHCYDLEGKKIWSKTFGKMRTRNAFGEGSSPLLTGDFIIVNWDHEGEDFIAALDKKTGEERWRKTRDEPTTWATPLAVDFKGKTQVVVSATNRIRSYDLTTGDQIWECGGMTTNVIPSPVTADGIVYAISGFRGNAVRAIRLGKTGDLTGTDAIAWSYDTKAPYVPSPLLSEGRLWFHSQNTGIISCLDAKTGNVLIDAQRLENFAGVYASPVAAAGKIYLTGRNGEGIVLRNSGKLEILATNKLEEKFDASPALAGKDLLLRGHQFLYCLSGS
ncbi:MAG: signal peptide protein [Verrucomicrobiales bacterium]|nr:signal peptide protein [Verrucomicrobiales bacterium]